MTETEIPAERFEANRSHLRSVAYRMLGSQTEADDAVQETFLRVMRAGTSSVDNFAGWLTTIVARVCLDMLRGRKSRREVPVDAEVEALTATDNLEREKLIADSVGVAMLVVLETLTPAERVAFVLHDMFNISFDEVATVVGRSPMAARQLASRGRRRVQGASAKPEADRARQREVVGAFFAASQSATFLPSSRSLIPTLCCVRTQRPWKQARVRVDRHSPRRSAVATPLRTSSEAAHGRRSSLW